MGLTITEVEPGEVTLVATPATHHVNLGGFLHGGYVSTLLDVATGYALLSTLPQGATAPHISASYQFLSSGPDGVQYVGRGEVLRAGNRVAHVRGELRTGDGRLLAVAQTTHAIIIDAPATIAGAPKAGA
jgi:acyl-CoA thioesterase